MDSLSKISSTGLKVLERRVPLAFDDVDLNFCRNPRCSDFGVNPDPYKRPRGKPPAPAGLPRGVVKGEKHQEFLQCGTCGKTSLLKDNRAIVEEYRRQTHLKTADPTVPSCSSKDCFAHGFGHTAHPELYRRFGKTAKGDPRFQCRICGKTFSVGKPARRQLRSDKNRMIFQMFCNEVSLSKICKIADTSYRDLYGKIDFFHDQIQGFTAAREDFSKVDFAVVGARFATDSQSLMLNWPTKRQRTPVASQHLCTAHHRSGFIIEAAFQFDASMSLEQAEEQALAADEEHLSTAFRQHARVWTQQEFQLYLASLKKRKEVKEINLYQLPHEGVLVRYDILQYSHALRMRDVLAGIKAPVLLTMDDDKGLQRAFQAAFVDRIRKGDLDIAVVSFDKGMSNDRRNQAVAAGQARLSEASGLPIDEIRMMPDEDYSDLVDHILTTQGAAWPLASGMRFPFSRKSEPNKVVRVPTWRDDRPALDAARLLRRATLRSVDTYFHKIRSNVRFAGRPSISAGNVGHTWDKHYLYKPDVMGKMIQIYRFYHNWCDVGADKKTPAMRIGLARGRIYERDFM